MNRKLEIDSGGIKINGEYFCTPENPYLGIEKIINEQIVKGKLKISQNQYGKPFLEKVNNNELHISDVEWKIQERMEELESKGDVESKIRLDELGKLQGWILCDEDY